MSGVTAQVSARVQALRSRYADRDRRMAEVQAVRRGRIESIAPGLFSEQWQRPIVANMIENYVNNEIVPAFHEDALAVRPVSMKFWAAE